MKLSMKAIVKSKIVLDLRLKLLGLYTPLSSPVLVNSIPKCGTNLLRNIVLSIPGTIPARHVSVAHFEEDPQKRLEFLKEQMQNFQPGAIYTGHVPYSPEIAEWFREKGIKQIFIYRDPRDYTVSFYHFAMRFKNHTRDWQRQYYENFAACEDNSARLMACIQGIGKGANTFCTEDNSHPNVRLYYDAYMPWISDRDVHSVRFEDFITEGGLEIDAGVETVKGILDYLKFKPSKPVDVRSILLKGQDPDRSNTYRKGVSGQWREEYREEHIMAFKAVVGNLLHELGYEDFN